MTYRTLAEALDFTQDELLTGVATGIFTTNETLAFTEVLTTDRAVIKGNREVALAAGAVRGCDTTITSEKNETAPYTHPIESFINQFDVCRTVQGLASSFTDQVALDAAMAAKGLGRTIENQLINGAGVAGASISGWDSLVAASQIIPAATPGTLALEDLDHLWDITTVRSGRMAYACNAATKRAITKLLRAAGGINQMDLAGTDFVVPTVNGYPVLVNNWIPNGEIYFVNMDPGAQGLALFLGTNGAPAESLTPIIGLFPVGWRHDKDRQIWRLTADITQVLQSELAMAKLEITPGS